MQTLPSAPGLFYLLNKSNEIIYISKGLNIRKNVISLITKAGNKKSLKLREETDDVRCEATGSMVMASILEYFELQKHQPRYNKKNIKAFQPGKTFKNFNGYMVLRGRTNDEETFIKITKAKLQDSLM